MTDGQIVTGTGTISATLHRSPRLLLLWSGLASKRHYFLGIQLIRGHLYENLTTSMHVLAASTISCAGLLTVEAEAATYERSISTHLILSRLEASGRLITLATAPSIYWTVQGTLWDIYVVSQGRRAAHQRLYSSVVTSVTTPASFDLLTSFQCLHTSHHIHAVRGRAWL